LDHLVGSFPPARVLGIEKLLLGVTAMLFAIISKEQTSRAPSW
jgi:hypothetical protein